MQPSGLKPAQLTVEQTSAGLESIAVAPARRVCRVLYLTDLRPADKFGSLEEQIFIVAQALKQKGGMLLPVFGAPVGPQAERQYQLAGLRAESLDLHKFNFATLRKLLALVHDSQIERVHWNFYNPINPYVWFLSLLTPRVKHYLTDHNSRIPSEPRVSRSGRRLLKSMLLKRYSRVLGISDFVVGCLEQQKVWSNLTRCTYFVNTERFKPDAGERRKVRAELGVVSQFVLLFVGNMIKWKGGEVAVKAIAELPEQVVLCVLGDGEWLGRMRQLADELGVTQRIRFLRSQRHVEPYMKAADCLLCPSTWEEATGLVNLEALASGLPVIASRIGGIPEFVEHQKTGLLFPPGDHQQLANSIKYLLDNPAELAAMGQAARAAAVSNYSIERRLPEYVELYSCN